MQGSSQGITCHDYHGRYNFYKLLVFVEPWIHNLRNVESADCIVSGKRRREFCIDGWLLTRGIPSRFSSGLVVRMKLLACPKIRTTSLVPLDPNNPWKNGGFFRPPNMGYISSLKMKVMGSHNLISIVLKCCFVFYWCLLEFLNVARKSAQQIGIAQSELQQI